MTALRNLGDTPAGAPDSVAVIDLSGPSPALVTYEQLDREADAVASRLQTRGLSRGTRVGILGANSSAFLAAYFGILRAGLVAVPVNWRLPAATISFILEDAGAALVFADAERIALCPASIPTETLGEPRPAGPQAAAAFGSVAVGDADPALFLYTSGSTGRAKGVVLSHRAYGWVLDIRTRGLDLSEHRFVVAAPLYHMNALNTVQLALRGGARVVLLPRFEARSFLRAVAEYRATWLTMVPAMIALMAQEQDLIDTLDLRSTRTVRLGSAPLGPAIVEATRRIFPQATLSNGYGTTEIGSVVFGPHPDGRPVPPLALGFAHPAVSLRLRDSAGAEADEGVLEVRTPATMSGYHGLPELTARSFTPDGYYITNDVVRRDVDGCFWFVGRSDDMFVCGGENVYPGEVEALLERHPAVAEACVVPVADETKGQKPCAFVVPRAGASLDPDEVKRFALAEGPAHAHPRAVYVLPAMPLAGTGKIDRASLKTRAQELSARPQQPQPTTR